MLGLLWGLCCSPAGAINCVSSSIAKWWATWKACIANLQGQSVGAEHLQGTACRGNCVGIMQGQRLGHTCSTQFCKSAAARSRNAAFSAAAGYGQAG